MNFSRPIRRRPRGHAPFRGFRTGSRAVILIDGTPIRAKARKAYDKAVRDLQKSREEHERFLSHDQPQFGKWLNLNFGAILTENRETNSELAQSQQLVAAVQSEFYYGNHRQIVDAYRVVLNRQQQAQAETANPPDPESDAGNPDHPFGEEQKSPTGNEPPHDPFEDFLRGLFEEAEQKKAAYEELHRDSIRAKTPPPSSRLKELYRNLVRKLHPDMIEDFDEKKRETWHLAQEAYEKQDVEQLEVILTLCEIEEKGLAKSTSVSLLMRITNQLKSSLRTLRNDLRRFKADQAWGFSQASDLAAVEIKVRTQLLAELEQKKAVLLQVRQTIAHWDNLLKVTPAPRKRRRAASGRA